MNEKFILETLYVATETDCTFALTDGISEYDYMSHHITYNPDEPEIGFMRHLREVHKAKWCDKYDYRLWGLLHEIGHAETFDDIPETGDEDDLATRVACSMMSLEEVAKSEKLQDLYFNLPTEWEATEWAAEWAESHPDIMAELTNCYKVIDQRRKLSH